MVGERVPWFAARELHQLRYWIGYWLFHFTHHPRLAWRTFKPWLLKREAFHDRKPILRPWDADSQPGSDA